MICSPIHGSMVWMASVTAAESSGQGCALQGSLAKATGQVASKIKLNASRMDMLTKGKGSEGELRETLC